MSTHNHQMFNDEISNIFYNAIKGTWEDKVVQKGSGFRYPRYRYNPNEYLVGMCSDGIGTKANIAGLLGEYETLGYDLVAMTCDDAIAMGGIPYMMTTTLDIGEYDGDITSIIQDLAYGLLKAAQFANVPVVGGESARLGRTISGKGRMPFIWNSTVMWTCGLENLITGDMIKVGDSIIALPETGCRSNGFTLLKKILAENLGGYWYKTPLNDSTYGHLALQPSRIYSPQISYVLYHHNKCKISGLIHVTGGGLVGRLKSYLYHHGLGAIIDNPIDPGTLLQSMLINGWVSTKTAYETWGMGHGFLIITSNPSEVINLMSDKNIKDVKIVGQVIDTPKITISTKSTVEWS